MRYDGGHAWRALIHDHRRVVGHRRVIVLCPTRGRPKLAAQMVRSLRDTAHRIGTTALLVVDEDDPCLDAYLALPLTGLPYRERAYVMVLAPDQTGDLVRATNSAYARLDGDEIIGHVGDDHLFRTPGWDTRITAVLQEPGIAYGDDLHQGPNLPTAVFLSPEIPRALGWYALPGSTHLYIDNTWKMLGEALGRLHYLPDVVIEHMHATLGKSPMDEGVARASAHQTADYAAFLAWQANDLAADVARVQEALR